MNATSFYGFGGAYAVGLLNNDIPLTTIVEPASFGLEAIEENAARLGFHGSIHRTAEPEFAALATIVLGNPPCSGFSLLNTAKTGAVRAIDSSINHCMVELVDYASRVRPLTVVFESVQGAGRQGQEFMQQLLARLNRQTGLTYSLTNVFMSGATVGAAQIRKRYFWVASQMPFGLDVPELAKVTTYEDAIGDLKDLPLQQALQPYGETGEVSLYAKSLRAEGVVDHHLGASGWERRMADLGEFFEIGDTHRMALLRAKELGVDLESWSQYDFDKVIYGKQFSNAVRINPQACGYVVAGNGGMPFVHWANNRTLTVRETARLMGFPDWFTWSTMSISRAFTYLGKQVPVQSWTWILQWIKSSLLGAPGPLVGEEIANNGGAVVRSIDVTLDYKAVYHERTKENVDSRSKAWKHHMATRQ